MAEQKKVETVDDNAAMKAELAELRGLVSALLRAQSPLSAETAYAKQQMKDIAYEGALAAITAYASLPTEKRSQYETNKIGFNGAKIFKVLLGTGRPGELPPLYIKADLESDAKSRYQLACNVTSVKQEDANAKHTTWACADVTNDPKAQEAVKAVWQYQPTAA